MAPKRDRTNFATPGKKALPAFLRDSYKQYKDDTFGLIGWLVQKARKTGYPTSSVDTCAALLDLARHVSKKTRRLPTLIAADARRAIDLRKSVSRMFVRRGSGHDRKNKTHAYFIQVLEEILQMFDTNDSAPEREPEASSNAQSWVNSFDALTVEDSEEFAEPDSAVAHSEVVRITSTLDDAADEDDELLSQGFFRVLCLFHDLQQWRKLIVQTWTEYSDYETDLTSAAVITDQALKFARGLIQETIDQLPSQFPREDLGLQTFIMASASLATGRLLPPSTELGLPYNVELSDVADSCLLGVGVLLQSFLPVIQPGRAPVYKAGHFGVYDPKADRVTMSAAEKFQEDKILLLEVLPDFYLLERARDAIPGLDEVTLGMMEYMREREVSLWLCFAAQLMLDAHHATRHMRMGPFADLRMTGLRIGRTIDDYHELSRTHPPPRFWSLEGEELIRHIRVNISNFIEKDALFDLKSALLVQFKNADKPVDHLLFTRNPVLCGLFAFRLNLLMQTVGQALVSQWFDVQQLAFLLNLARNAPTYGNLDWPDMEMFIKIHGRDHIFMGSLPTSAAQSLKRLEIVTGISKASRFAADSRSAQSEWHKPDGADGRRLTPTTKTANLLRGYYGFEDGKPTPRNSIDGTELSKYLNELFGASAPKGARKSGNDKRNKKQVELIKANPQDLLGQKWHNKHNLGFIQLLTLLKSKLFEEEPHLLFNYFGMHKRSMELLRLIKRKEHHKFVQYFSEKYMPDDSMIQNLVILIHHVAQGSAREAQQMGLVKAGQQMTSRIVVSCAEIMKAYLEKNGDVSIKELRTFCKNKAPLLANQGKKQLETDDVDARKESEMYWFCLGEVLGPAQMAALNTGIPMQ